VPIEEEEEEEEEEEYCKEVHDDGCTGRNT
jgi:hypothetical protein